MYFNTHSNNDYLLWLQFGAIAPTSALHSKERGENNILILVIAVSALWLPDWQLTQPITVTYGLTTFPELRNKTIGLHNNETIRIKRIRKICR